MSKTLSPGELHDFTGTPHHKKQLEILRGMGLDPLVRPDGSLGVTWDAINAIQTRRKDESRHTGGVDFRILRRTA